MRECTFTWLVSNWLLLLLLLVLLPFGQGLAQVAAICNLEAYRTLDTNQSAF